MLEPQGPTLSERELVLRALLTEYNTLRQESLAAIAQRIQVMNFTFGAVAVAVAGLLTRRVSDGLAGVVALTVLPQVSKAGLLIWLGEYNRSQRAGRWLRQLEAGINGHLGAEALGWETELHKKDTHMSYPYRATAVLTLGFGYVSEVLGLYFLEGPVSRLHGEDFVRTWLVGAGVVLIVIESGFFWFFLKRWRAAATGEEASIKRLRRAGGRSSRAIGGR